MIEKQAHQLALKYLETKDFPQLQKWFTINRVDMLKAGCLAVGGDIDTLKEGIAAVCCVHMGIKIIDDLIDEDKRGIQHEVGVSQAANAAYIYQATAYKIIVEASMPTQTKLHIIDDLIHFGKTTSIGQYYDASQIKTIEDYYHALSLKSGPLFGDCMRIGATLNGATVTEADQLYQLGVIYGYLIQLNDDLSDTFAKPASNDWLPNRTNLPILYASQLEHQKKERFNQIRDLVLHSDDYLEEAQSILISSGAYFKVIEEIIVQSTIFQEKLDRSILKNKQPLQELLDELMSPVRSKINSLGLSYNYDQLSRWIIERRGQDAQLTSLSDCSRAVVNL